MLLVPRRHRLHFVGPLPGHGGDGDRMVASVRAPDVVVPPGAKPP